MGRGATSTPVTPYTYENGYGPKRNQSHSSILWSGRREVQGFASQTLVSLRAIGPCVLRWKMLTHFHSFAPCRVRFPSPGTLMKTALTPNGAKAVKTILWSGRRESNPRHQLGSVAIFYTKPSTCKNAVALPAVSLSVASKKTMFYSSVNAILRLFCDQDCDQKGETWTPCYLRKRSPPIR